MRNKRPFRQSVVTAFALMVWNTLPVSADQDVSTLLESLGTSTAEEAKRLDREIKGSWSRSGSAAMDLLLLRGREALEENDAKAAIEHFTALTDHAPDFAEGWHSLARAYFAAELYGPTLDALGRALALNPDNYSALFGLGVLFQQFQDYARAQDAFEQVLDLHPHHENAKQALESLKRVGIGRTL